MVPGPLFRLPRLPRPTRLAGCLALTFELASPLATAATVTSCDDGPNAPQIPGTLRYEIANAPDGATIDFDLPGFCSSAITLETGGLTIHQNSLVIQGPAGGVTIANDKYGSFNGQQPVNDRVINHQGTGLLTLSNLAITQGKYNRPHPKGGCISSAGNVTMFNTNVSSCVAVINSGTAYPVSGYTAYGGAVYTAGDLSMISSTITHNAANAPGPNFAQCGGADVRGTLAMINSTISDNEAFGYVAFGGGACAAKGATILASTVSSNTSMTNTKGFIPAFPAPFGGLWVRSDPAKAANYQLTISNSTISGNYSYSQPGAVYSNIPTAVFSSTFALNTVHNVFFGVFDPSEAAALDVSNPFTNVLDSSLFAGNTVYGTTERDFGARLYADTSKNPTITGQNNLIVASDVASVLPADTIFGQCPRLGPLRDNGGPTQTHALLSGSVAIDTGHNGGVGSYDQRGAPFVRESPPGFPDIGAYEVQKDDILFNSGFEGCP